MGRVELMAPCHFGLESVLKREIDGLGYDIVQVEDGKVTFTGGEEAVARANMFLRTTERILLKVGSFHAETFDELFEKTKALPWEKYIPKNGKFWVTKAASIKSKLFSPSDIQSIMKKAMVERLKQKHGIEWFPEDGDEFPVRVTIMKDEVSIGLDTTGVALHKRGYRKFTAKAPITETLAAALIMLTPWNKDRILVDPFCGSGTIPIEAALIGANIAPGMSREFTSRNWEHLVPQNAWESALYEAQDSILTDVKLNIQGYDIDDSILDAARSNAELAGVADMIHFQRRNVKDLSHAKKYGFIITNPPYGERLDDKEDMPELYRMMGEAFCKLDSWSYYIISGFEDAQKYFGRKADKNRKIYNGMLKTYFYQYMGPRPPKRSQETS